MRIMAEITGVFLATSVAAASAPPSEPPRADVPAAEARARLEDRLASAALRLAPPAEEERAQWQNWGNWRNAWNNWRNW